MPILISNLEEDTRNIAAKLAKKITSQVIALSGELGSGKTTFVQGFAKGLGIKEKIISPTFVLIRQHKISNTKRFLYHIDLYRLEGDKNFIELGLKDLLNSPNNLLLIEWAEKVKDLLPKDTVWIFFETINENQRRINFRGLKVLGRL